MGSVEILQAQQQVFKKKNRISSRIIGLEHEVYQTNFKLVHANSSVDRSELSQIQKNLQNRIPNFDENYEESYESIYVPS